MNDSGKLRRRFWEKVDRSNEVNTCWLWTASRTSAGYGHININGKMVLAHRLAWQFTCGPIPANLRVLHNCPRGDNPACVNPAHLWLGTDADNIADMDAKGRGRRVRLLGEQHGRAKLTEASVLEIRRLWACRSESQRALARRFGVCGTAVRAILTGRNWAWLAPKETVDKASTLT